MTTLHSAKIAAVFALSLFLTPSYADELQALPAAVTSPSTESASLNTGITAPIVTRVTSDIPTYVERGVVMVPLRPLAQFLELRVRNVLGVIIVERNIAGENVPAIRLIFRSGSAKAQLERAGVARSVTFPIPVQNRLGNVFVAARAISTIFGATTQSVPEEKGVKLLFQGRSGVFSRIVSNGYRGADAARVMIENNVGKALSLHLRGPQDVRIELGARERVTRNLRPGIYTFQAASDGMKKRTGVRRFQPQQRAVWNWGRK